MPETTAFDDYEILLKEFQKLPVTERTYPTAMEIAGYDHYEQFFTRFLSFFLSTT